MQIISDIIMMISIFNSPLNRNGDAYVKYFNVYDFLLLLFYRDTYLSRTTNLYIPATKKIITEYQIIREIIWLVC